MKYLSLEKDGKIICPDIENANNFFRRFMGLMYRKSMPLDHGLLLTPCNEIHTFFMRFAIDTVYISKDNTIVYIDEAVEPNKIRKRVKGAYKVLELNAGIAKEIGIAAGDKINFRGNYLMDNTSINRNNILGDSARDYSFDKVLRGYDTKQVDEYIEKLIKSNKSSAEFSNERISDLKNEKEMLELELEQTQMSLKKSTNLAEELRQECDKLRIQANKKTVVEADNTEEVKALQERLEKVLTQNRLLQDENRNLTNQNRDLQRDVAHLSKKTDKNRKKINDLMEQVESDMDTDDKNFSEIIKIYESTIDKAEDLIYRLQTEFSLAHSKAEDLSKKAEE